jgi:hypothetical protein
MARLLHIQYPGAVHHEMARLTQAVRRMELRAGWKINRVKRKLERLERMENA